MDRHKAYRGSRSRIRLGGRSNKAAGGIARSSNDSHSCMTNRRVLAKSVRGEDRRATQFGGQTARSMHGRRGAAGGRWKDGGRSVCQAPPKQPSKNMSRHRSGFMGLEIHAFLTNNHMFHRSRRRECSESLRARSGCGRRACCAKHLP